MRPRRERAYDVRVPPRWMNRVVTFAPLAGIPFVGGAVHHALSLATPGADDHDSAARHLIFVGVNLLFAALFARRVRWTLAPAIALTAQQTYSHGGAFLEARRLGQFDGQSLSVLLFLPVVLTVAACLFLARRERTATTNFN